MIDLDAGCCGMAGSFGYEVEHYEISRLVGEQRLLPAVRQAEPDDVIVAPGFSCRLQIQHFTGREAVHPAVLLDLCFLRIVSRTRCILRATSNTSCRCDRGSIGASVL